MADVVRNRSSKSERTLLAALLLSAPGPLIISYAAITSRSATQMADFIRRSAELVATFVSWLIFRILRKNPESDVNFSQRLERITNLTVAIAMSCSAIALFIVGMNRFLSERVTQKVILGLIIAVLGLMVNIWFWIKYASMHKDQPDPVIYAQHKLYRGKAVVDICVVSALLAVTIAPIHPITKYIDGCGSIAVAFYLLYSGIGIFRHLAK